MKNLRKAASAAIAAFATLVGSNSLWASMTQGTVVVVGFDTRTEVLVGMNRLWQVELLRHGGFVQHRFIDNPELLPTAACRNIAIRWDIAVFQNRPTSAFNNLLLRSAQNNCHVTFTRVTAQNPDGSFNMVTVAPIR